MEDFFTNILPLLVLALISAVSSWIAKRREVKKESWELPDDFPEPIPQALPRETRPKTLEPHAPLPPPLRRALQEAREATARVLERRDSTPKPLAPLQTRSLPPDPPPSLSPSSRPLPFSAQSGTPVPNLRNPQTARQAILASVILSPPKGLDPDF